MLTNSCLSSGARDPFSLFPEYWACFYEDSGVQTPLLTLEDKSKKEAKIKGVCWKDMPEQTPCDRSLQPRMGAHCLETRRNLLCLITSACWEFEAGRERVE